MLGLNSLTWLALLVWVVIPLLVIVGATVSWRRSKTQLQKGLVLTASIAILFAPMLVSNVVKWWYDRQVEAMCAKDGGVKVYETVRLPAERFDKFNAVSVPLKENRKSGDEYYYEWDIQYYRQGNPELWRNRFQLIRAADGKVLGEAIGYSRRGGDVPGPWHDSSFGCPDDGDISFLKTHVFMGGLTKGRNK